MQFQATISINVERIEGKFATADEVQEALQQMIDDANYGSIDGIGPDGATSYEITDWDATVEHITRRKRK